MDWYRRYHGTCRHHRIEEAAIEAGMPRPYVIAAWDAVLELASSNDERGCVESVTGRQIAILIGCTLTEGDALLAALVSVTLIEDGHIRDWDARQFESDKSTDRVRRFREKKASKIKRVTPGNGDETFQKRFETRGETPQIRSEQIRSEQIIADQIRSDFLPPPQAVTPAHAHAREEGVALVPVAEPCELGGGMIAGEILSAMAAKVAMFAVSELALQREANVWVTALGTVETERIMLQSLEARNPMSYCRRAIGNRAVDLEVAREEGRERANKPDADLQAYYDTIVELRETDDDNEQPRTCGGLLN